MQALGRDRGFTLVELMVVVLIIGVLVTIDVPVYTMSRLEAESRACQTNQRTIYSSIELARISDVSFASASAGQFTSGGSGWYRILISDGIKSKPVCPAMEDSYYLSATGEITGDRGVVFGFKDDHATE